MSLHHFVVDETCTPTTIPDRVVFVFATLQVLLLAIGLGRVLGETSPCQGEPRYFPLS